MATCWHNSSTKQRGGDTTVFVIPLARLVPLTTLENNIDSFIVLQLLEIGLNYVHEAAYSVYLRHVYNNAVAETLGGGIIRDIQNKPDRGQIGQRSKTRAQAFGSNKVSSWADKTWSQLNKQERRIEPQRGQQLQWGQTTIRQTKEL
jgi:hypothetical protein